MPRRLHAIQGEEQGKGRGQFHGRVAERDNRDGVIGGQKGGQEFRLPELFMAS